MSQVKYRRITSYAMWTAIVAALLYDFIPGWEAAMLALAAASGLLSLSTYFYQYVSSRNGIEQNDGEIGPVAIRHRVEQLEQEWPEQHQEWVSLLDQERPARSRNVVFVSANISMAEEWPGEHWVLDQDDFETFIVTHSTPPLAERVGLVLDPRDMQYEPVWASFHHRHQSPELDLISRVPVRRSWQDQVPFTRRRRREAS